LEFIQDSDPCFATITQNETLTYTAGFGALVNYQADIPRLICDSLILPEIMPPTPGASYYSESMGGGMQFSTGDTLDYNSVQLPNDIIDSLYIFDPSDPCASEKLYSFMIELSPRHNIPNDTTLCGDFRIEPFSGPVTTPNAQYSSSREFSSASLLSVGDVISSSQMVYLADTASYILGDCVLLDSFFVNIITAPHAGMDTIITICAGEETIITDPFLLLRDAETGGQWTGPVIADVSYNDFRDVDLSFMTPADQFTFVYTIEKQGCPIDLASVTVNATAALNPGDSTAISLCASDPPQNLFQLIGNPDPGGFWQLTSGQLIFFSDFSSADFFGLPDDIYIFDYTHPASGSCPAQVAELIIDLGSGTNAGADNSATVCKGDSLDLFSILSSDANTAGEFKVDGFLPIPDGLWDSNLILLDEGEVNIQYTVGNAAGNCGSDTSDFVINLIKEPFAGTVNMFVTGFCEGDSVYLSDILENETEGGQFYRLHQYDDTISNLQVLERGIIDIGYIIATSCGADTNGFNIMTRGPLIVDLQLSATDLCIGDEECITLDVPAQGSADTEFFIVPVGSTDSSFFTQRINPTSTFQVCPENTLGQVIADSIFIGTQSNTIEIGIKNIDRGDCNLFESSSINITINESYSVDRFGSVCENETTTIDGIDYGSSTVVPLISQTGCDSIINIIIDTFPSSVGMITGNYCTGIPATILNMTFTGNTDEFAVFPGQSVFGCDSSAQVLLIFSDQAIGDIDTTLCRGDFIEIDGTMIMDEGMTEVDYLLGSVAGCDSSTIVNVILADSRQGTIDTTICLGQTINIDGIIIMDAGMLDIPYAPGTVLGCDSSTLVTVLEVTQIEGTIDTTICDGTIIEIDGVQIMTEGMTDVPYLPGTSSGCDSSTMVNVVYADAVQADLIIDACRTDTITIDGVEIVDQVRTEVPSPTSSVNGCDSTTIVFLRYPDTTADVILGTLCPYDETVEIMGMVYDTSTIPDEIILSDVNGCDSVYIDIAYRIIQDTIWLRWDPVCSEVEEAIIRFNGAGNSLPVEIYVNGNLDTTILDTPTNFIPFDITGTSGLNTIRTVGKYCELSRTIDIPILSNSTLDLFADETADNFFELRYLFSDNFDVLNWSGSPLLSCTGCDMPTITIEEDTEITLTVITEDSCTISESILLNYEGLEIDSTLKVYQPTAFSLSEQGNDAFFLQTNYDININHLRIYDRWGNLVFENQNFPSNDRSQGWNGRYNSKEVEQGVYIYTLEYEDPQNGVQVRNGSLTVFR